ncbi:AI-2E family transporter [Acidisoma silvae]|uniref:AI-2E family transporter n=1 Tax=Acidisoma silvae TaxID=2802396 RepID=A0A963YS12_9PROT|nr:AI-2E family transporter [Acidisoma silvae]MCB8875318.1 AI-2E family transporter [Acidisoma silvae]
MFGTTNKLSAAGWSIRDTILWVFGTTVACVMIWLLHQELLLVFLATLFAVSLRGASEWIRRHTGLPTRWAMAVIMILVVVAFIGFWWWVGPQLVQQAIDLGKTLTQEGGNLASRYGHTNWGRSILEKLSSAGSQAAEAMAGSMLTAATSTVGAIAAFFVLIVTMLYFASSPDLYVKGLVTLVPQSRRARVHEVLGKVAAVLRWWFLGQLIDMAVVGLLTTIGLLIIGMPMALALGVIAGILTFVPYFGAILAAIPALAIALGQGMHMTLLAAVVFGICHFVEGYIMSPMVQDRMVKLPPALLILSMTFLGSLLGPMGIILATPLAAVGLVLVSEFYVVDVLKDESGRDVTGH